MHAADAAPAIDALLDRMTLAEQCAQLVGVRPCDLADSEGRFDPERAAEAIPHGVGHVARIGGWAGREPRDAAAFANSVQRFCREETRHGIPAIPHEECLCGYMGPGGTVVPQAIGMAATFDPDLLRATTDAIGAELAGIGCRQALSPVLDVGRDPRFGRIEETFGESPALIEVMATAFVDGIQDGDGPALGATVKHFIGHGTPSGGRSRASVSVGPRDLRAVHARPFETVIAAADPDGAMNAYNDVDGRPCGGAPELLEGLLRDDLGFDGTVVSDYFSVPQLASVHGVASDDREAARQALTAGIDVELPEADAYRALEASVESGDLDRSVVRRSCRRVLEQKAALGLFADPTIDAERASDRVGAERTRQLAQRAARESVTIVESGPLPIDDPDRIAVVGPQADATVGLLGDYAYPVHMEDPDACAVVSPVEGLRRTVDARIDHAPGCPLLDDDRSGIEEARSVAADADLAIAVVGARSGLFAAETEDGEYTGLASAGEGISRSGLGLPGVQPELLDALAAVDTPTVAVVVAGRPLRVDAAVDGLVYAWLPGERGGLGLAEALAGTDPGGRLPVSIPRSAGHVPAHHARRPQSGPAGYRFGPGDPAHAFGAGESYATIEYGPLEAPDASETTAPLELATTVTNVSDRPGVAVPQVYATDLPGDRTSPERELCGFARVDLDPGASKRVSWSIPAVALADYDADVERVLHPGPATIALGRSSADLVDRQSFDLTGDPARLPPGRDHRATVTIE
ncbi:beta-glucosidase [Halococcoides cellulosivorans]|uniref:Glycosyl hydrolase n=1 Tax=Halococcoides cellulosivorans TaxID=1679096 RepID=A0A2R4X227_9EURY|nr:glycoside hydrolase family 3 N-terminal domain-containing protein [Halococcoides cellulosivorans]AWB27841.1 glycosyl hydrolase [Halococcoides cellulosivorans]